MSRFWWLATERYLDVTVFVICGLAVVISLASIAVAVLAK